MYTFKKLATAESFRNRCDKVMMIVLFDNDTILVVTPAVAKEYEAKGYEIR